MIVVSGATGFLGSHTLCLLLEKGMRVRALKRQSSALHEFNCIFSIHFEKYTDSQRDEYSKRIEWFDADILDIPALENALEGATEIYHCAATVSFVGKHKEQMMQVNVQGTANMVNIALLKGVKRFCHVSSIAALGREKSGVHVTENTRWADSKLNSNYAISKYKAEMEVWRGIEEGLNAVIVNPSVILGVGNWEKGSCKLFDLSWQQLPFYTEGINGYVDVRDVARAMYELMQRPETFTQRYILSGDNMSMKDFMHTTAELFGKKKASIRINKFLAEVAWRAFAIKSLFTGKDPSITKETARASLNQYFYSSKKIEDAIGFRFIPMNETLTYICQYFKQQHTK